jgi:hypothetical protein
LSEEGLVGLGASAEQEVAGQELGLAESVYLVGAGQQAGQGEEFFVHRVAEQREQFLGAGLLVGGEGSRQGNLLGKGALADLRGGLPSCVQNVH